MPAKHRSAFLLVRSHADLARASEGLAAYLAILRRAQSVNDFETFQGIWIDEEGVANLPCALVLPDVDAKQRTVRILEATGINGIWMLCWLDAAASSVSRVDLVTALLACFGHEETAKLAARFIPILTDDARDLNAQAELQVLEARYPRLVLPPICQDPNGALILTSSQPRHQGTLS